MTLDGSDLCATRGRDGAKPAWSDGSYAIVVVKSAEGKWPLISRTRRFMTWIWRTVESREFRVTSS